MIEYHQTNRNKPDNFQIDLFCLHDAIPCPFPGLPILSTVLRQRPLRPGTPSYAFHLSRKQTVSCPQIRLFFPITRMKHIAPIRPEKKKNIIPSDVNRYDMRFHHRING